MATEPPRRASSLAAADHPLRRWLRTVGLATLTMLAVFGALAGCLAARP